LEEAAHLLRPEALEGIKPVLPLTGGTATRTLPPLPEEPPGQGVGGLEARLVVVSAHHHLLHLRGQGGLLEEGSGHQGPHRPPRGLPHGQGGFYAFGQGQGLARLEGEEADGPAFGPAPLGQALLLPPPAIGLQGGQVQAQEPFTPSTRATMTGSPLRKASLRAGGGSRERPLALR
jgi:hypothetical protein